jgi:DNA-binding LacI/PurR family transcriptional regulator
MTRGTKVGGRALNNFLEQIEKDISGGKYQPGKFLPSTRTLAKSIETSPETARRGLKILQQRGVLLSEGQAGFRVAKVDSNKASRPLALINKSIISNSPDVQPTTAALFLAFQEAGARRGWPLLGVHEGDGGTEAIVRQIQANNPWGVILDTIDKQLLDAVIACDLPIVMVNSWSENSPLNTVLQDNYRGGFQAAQYLTSQGAKQIAWVGPVNAFCHSRERFAGASACLRAAGLKIKTENCLELPAQVNLQAVTELLSRKDRPDGILALGLNNAALIKEAADKQGLEIGRDFQLISWVAEECYQQHYRPIFGPDTPAPAIVWSTATMVERALSLLTEITEGPTREQVRISVPTRLKFEGEQP